MVSVIQKTHVTNKGPQKLMTIQMTEFFNVPLIASSYGGVDLGLKSHMKEAWGDKACSFTTTPPRHPFPIFQPVKYLIKGLQTFHHAPPLHLHQTSTITLLIN